jgi:hypothetical protein
LFARGDGACLDCGPHLVLGLKALIDVRKHSIANRDNGCGIDRNEAPNSVPTKTPSPDDTAAGAGTVTMSPV